LIFYGKNNMMISKVDWTETYFIVLPRHLFLRLVLSAAWQLS